MELIEFFAGPDMQRFLFDANGLFPASTSVFRALGDADAIDGFEAMNEQAEYIVTIPYDRPWYIEFERQAEQLMLRAARGEQSPQEALAELADFARELKAEYE